MKRIVLLILTVPCMLRAMVVGAFAAPAAQQVSTRGMGYTEWLLLLVVAGVLLLFFLLLRQYRLVRRLKLLAERDELTGLMNKRTFCIETGRRLTDGKHYTLVRFDVDHFKRINDTMGTAAGDKLLQIIGTVLLESTKARWEVVSVGRLDADHFAVCATMNRPDAEEFCQQLEKAIHLCASGYEITLRFGMCSVDTPFADVSAYCDHSMTALRSIKDIYRDSIAWYDEGMACEEQRIQELEDEMETALAQGQFVPYYQAQYNYETGEIIGAEALVRWIHPQKGMIPPDRFIPQFEKNGFIYRMDLAVWEQVCAQLKAWQDAGVDAPRVSVNVSRRDITHSELPRQIKDMVDRYGLTPDMLHLESTETGFTECPEQMLEATRQARALGFFIEIDDFGSGNSSLNTLRQLPVDVLKLDLRFLDERGGTGSSRGGLILSAVVRMAHSLNMPVIAEGVETKEQADFLKSVGCLYMQGYYFARPVSAADFEALLRQGRTARLRTYSGNSAITTDFLDASTQSTLLFNSFVGGAGIFEYREGRLEALRLNDQFFVTTHIPREGHNGYCVDIISTLTEQTRADFVRMLDDVVAGGKQSCCYCCLNRESTAGPNQWFFNRAHCLQQKDSAYILYIAMENVTGWMRSVQQNKQRHRDMELLLAHFPGGLAVLRCIGGSLRGELYGGTLPQQLGYTREEMLHLTEKDALALVHSGCRERVEEACLAMLRGGQFHAQYRLVAKDGIGIWFDVSGVLAGTAEDGRAYFCYTDLMEQRQMSRELLDGPGEAQQNGAGVTMQDALTLVGTDLCKVLQVDLTADTFQIIRSELPEPDEEHGICFSAWVDAVGGSQLIYPDDQANFRTVVTVPYLREYFEHHSDCFRFYYRRRMAQGYRWVCMEMLRTGFFTLQHQTVMLYIRDIHESYEVEVRQRENNDYMLHHDVLTGVRNRLSYSERLNDLLKGHESVGVIYADINGLKATNDTKGHDAGDALIVSFAHRLSSVFGGENCYRISGDEFVVLMNTDKPRFLALEKSLLTPLNREGHPIASYGSAWCGDSAQIDVARREAEESMYRWKRVHYTNYPELGRRERLRHGERGEL